MSEVELPEGWILETVHSVARVASGVGFPKKYQGKLNATYPVYKVGDISSAVLKKNGHLTSSNNYVSENEAKELKGEVFPQYSTLFAKIGEAVKLNRRALLGVEGLADNNVMAVVPEEIINKKFVYYFMRTVDLSSSSRSTTVPSVRKGDIESLAIPIPPLPEQKIIADKLDTLLAQVETTKARLERLPEIIKRFRQSVLAAAVSGRLTEEWRGSESIEFNQPPVKIGNETAPKPKGWSWELLTNLAVLESGHTPRKSVLEYWQNGDVPWICLQDIRAVHGKIISKTKYMPTQLGIENSSARLLPKGTVCFSRDISVGFTTIMGREMSTTQHFANWVCGPKLNNFYLMYALMSAKESLTISGQGTTVKTIYMPALKKFQILTPPLEEQTQIVHRVETLFAHADRLEAQAKAALERVNNLTQSILAKAFRGELTAEWRKENPELISGEHSAAALLEKIQVERAALSSKKRASKTRRKAKPSA